MGHRCGRDLINCLGSGAEFLPKGAGGEAVKEDGVAEGVAELVPETVVCFRWQRESIEGAGEFVEVVGVLEGCGGTEGQAGSSRKSGSYHFILIFMDDLNGRFWYK